MSATALSTPQTARARARRGSVTRPADGALWAQADRLITGLLLAIGALLILLAWLGASGTTQWDTQLRWTGLAVLGVVVACVGVGVWLFRGFIRVRTEARALRTALGARLARPVRTGTPDGAERVTAAGMAHSHLPDCMLVGGKTVRQVTAGDDLAPCGVCS